MTRGWSSWRAALPANDFFRRRGYRDARHVWRMRLYDRAGMRVLYDVVVWERMLGG